MSRFMISLAIVALAGCGVQRVGSLDSESEILVGKRQPKEEKKDEYKKVAIADLQKYFDMMAKIGDDPFMPKVPLEEANKILKEAVELGNKILPNVKPLAIKYGANAGDDVQQMPLLPQVIYYEFRKDKNDKVPHRLFFIVLEFDKTGKKVETYHMEILDGKKERIIKLDPDLKELKDRFSK